MQVSNCPICHSKNLRPVKGEIVFPTQTGEVAIPEVTRLKCVDCGEEFFDHKANKVLDQYRGRNKKSWRQIKTS